MMEAWQEFWRLFDKGGFVMPLLLVGSLLTVAVAVPPLPSETVTVKLSAPLKLVAGV